MTRLVLRSWIGGLMHSASGGDIVVLMSASWYDDMRILKLTVGRPKFGNLPRSSPRSVSFRMYKSAYADCLRGASGCPC